MNSLGLVAFTFALMACGLGVFVYTRLNNQEEKLKELAVIPKEFSSLEPGKKPPS